jgi:hypothetical protein
MSDRKILFGYSNNPQDSPTQGAENTKIQKRKQNVRLSRSEKLKKPVSVSK